MSEWAHWCMLWLAESTDEGVDITPSCNCHCLCLCYLLKASVFSGFVIIMQASRLEIGVGRFSRPVRGVGVLTMPDAGLDTTGCVESVWEVPLGAGVLWQLVSGVVVGVFIENQCVADGLKVGWWVISLPGELFREDEGVEFWPCIVEATELPPWGESLFQATTYTHHLPGGSWEFPDGHCIWGMWRVARLRSFHTTGVLWESGLLEDIVRHIYVQCLECMNSFHCMHIH
jgi:hypothetical protein